MCIIVAKNAGIPMLEPSILQNCWRANPDGAGFMYAANNRVYIQKGFMTYKSLTDALDRLGKVYSLDKLPLVIHFRISTQGGVNSANTHPFPITKNIGELTSPKSSSKIGGMAHNGIIKKYSHYGTPSAYSDTLLFVKHAVAQVVHTAKDLDRKGIMTDLEKLADSKLAFLSGDGVISLYDNENGKGWNYDANNVAFSNYTWYGYAYSWTRPGSRWWNEWTDYDDDYLDICYPYGSAYNTPTAPKKESQQKKSTGVSYVISLMSYQKNKGKQPPLSLPLHFIHPYPRPGYSHSKHRSNL